MYKWEIKYGIYFTDIENMKLTNVIIINDITNTCLSLSPHTNLIVLITGGHTSRCTCISVDLILTLPKRLSNLNFLF